MLIGQYDAHLTSKSQISFPKKFRIELGEELILTKGIESCLIIVSKKNYKTLLEGSENRPFLDQETREIQRYILGNAYEVKLDTKGRFLIPDFLKEFAHLHENIVFAGVMKYVEVWDKALWEDNQKFISVRIPTIAKQLANDQR